MSKRIKVAEFHGSEHITSVVNVEEFTGELYCNALVIGHYGEHGGGEIWIEQDGHRIQFPGEVLAQIVKQLKRAAQLAMQEPQQ